jgi:hypothetical protein
MLCTGPSIPLNALNDKMNDSTEFLKPYAFAADALLEIGTVLSVLLLDRHL